MTDDKPDDLAPYKFDLTPEEMQRAYNLALRFTAMDLRAKKVVPFPKARPPKK